MKIEVHNELIVEDLESQDHPKSSLTTKNRQIKKFKLNTFQIEAEEETQILMSRTEALLQSKLRYSSMKTELNNTKKSTKKTSLQNYESTNKNVSEISVEAFKSRTEALLHSKTKRKKKKRDLMVPIPDQAATDSSGSSWSNIPRCFQNPDSCITASILSSDAGISSMPSSMISNISEAGDLQKKVNIK